MVIAISFALGKGFWQIFIAIGLTMWVDVARVVRGQVILINKTVLKSGPAKDVFESDEFKKVFFTVPEKGATE